MTITARSGDDRSTSTGRIRTALEGALGVPFLPGNSIRRLKNGDEIFPAMLEAIEGAEASIDFETFVYWKGDIAFRFARALAAAGHRGVRVRVLLDGVGSIPMPDQVLSIMEESPVDVRRFRPPNPLRIWEVDHRSHHKILVCDLKVGFTGGVGIAEEWEGDARNPDEWRETHFRIEGPVVRALEAAFIEHWLSTSDADQDPGSYETSSEPGAVEPSLIEGGPGSARVQLVRSRPVVGWNDARISIRTLVSAAEKRLRIVTAYFVPEMALVSLLNDAVARGVEVQIMNPGPHTDQRIAQLAGEAVYEKLLEGGVRIFRYQPTMLHAKIVTVDGVLCSIGSVNLNHRSLEKDSEVALNVLDDALVTELDRDFEDDLERCVEVSEAEDWSRRSVLSRTAAWIARRFRREL